MFHVANPTIFIFLKMNKGVKYLAHNPRHSIAAFAPGSGEWRYKSSVSTIHIQDIYIRWHQSVNHVFQSAMNVCHESQIRNLSDGPRQWLSPVSEESPSLWLREIPKRWRGESWGTNRPWTPVSMPTSSPETHSVNNTRLQQQRSEILQAIEQE